MFQNNVISASKWVTDEVCGRQPWPGDDRLKVTEKERNKRMKDVPEAYQNES